jgi:hypothetical protein
MTRVNVVKIGVISYAVRVESTVQQSLGAPELGR